MPLSDDDLVRGLVLRDGPFPERTRRHWDTGQCRYAEKVGDRECPWCEAERRRLQAAV